jgi:hypothetical protein
MKFRPHARAHHNVPIPTSYDQELEVCRPPSHRRNDRMRMPSTAVHGPIPPCGRLCRSHPQGREARRSASAGVSEIRACDQSQNRRGARANCAPNTAGARRRADRVTIRFAALHMSLYGTKLTKPMGQACPQLAKADVAAKKMQTTQAPPPASAVLLRQTSSSRDAL